jgi:hypothetical protein
MARPVTMMARGIAFALGVTALASGASLIVFFAVGGPFGRINDVGNATVGVLGAALAVVTLERAAWVWLAALGATLTIVGSVLVITDITGYFFAGLVSALGFALIGTWLFGIARSESARSRLGMAAGLLMMLGYVDIAGILQGQDNQDTAPAWLLAAGVGWAGTYLLMPIWAVRVSMQPDVTTDRVSGVE